MEFKIGDVWVCRDPTSAGEIVGVRPDSIQVKYYGREDGSVYGTTWIQLTGRFGGKRDDTLDLVCKYTEDFTPRIRKLIAKRKARSQE